MMSIRLGIALMAIAPITVASVMSVRNQLLMGLQHMATHDPLTDLLNRRAFADIAGKKISAAARLNQPVAFLMLDIDHFKSINDTYGHGAGDQVLSKLAASMRSGLREDDVLGRLGGEEFAVLLGGCTPEQATVIAERVRTCVRDDDCRSLRRPACDRDGEHRPCGCRDRARARSSR